ncbi:hypothetical protein ACA910_009490 [Epithemia clementina (nom. ined.)]
MIVTLVSGLRSPKQNNMKSTIRIQSFSSSHCISKRMMDGPFSETVHIQARRGVRGPERSNDACFFD